MGLPARRIGVAIRPGAEGMAVAAVEAGTEFSNVVCMLSTAHTLLWFPQKPAMAMMLFEKNNRLVESHQTPSHFDIEGEESV